MDNNDMQTLRQARTSILIREALEQGAHFERGWANGETGDGEVNIVEFANVHGVYIVDNAGVTFADESFETTVETLSAGVEVAEIDTLWLRPVSGWTEPEDDGSFTSLS